MISPSRHRNLAVAFSILFLLCQIWLCAAPVLTEKDPDSVFLGFRHLPTDHYAYMMYSAQTKEDGSILTRNMFTTAPQDGRFLMIGLAATGLIQKLVPLSDALVWHSIRILVLAAFCLVLWKLCLTIFKGGRKAVVAHTFVLFSGGLEWIARPLFGDRIAASGAPWANFIDNPWNFSVFYASTNLVWAIPMTITAALVLLEMRWLIQAGEAGGGRMAQAAIDRARRKTAGLRGFSVRFTSSEFLPGLVRGLAFAVLWFIHPYSAIVWALLVAIAIFFPPTGVKLGRSILVNIPVGAGPVLVGLFILWSQQDPVVALSNAQTGLWKLSYPLYLYPIVYGPWLLLPLGLIVKKDVVDRPVLRWMVLWFAAGFLMTLNPLVTGAKFQFSFFIPLALLEVTGLFAIIERVTSQQTTRTFRWRMEAAFVAVAALNSGAGLLLDVNPPATREVARTTHAHLMALETLKALPDGGVLCDPHQGQIVPWKSGKPVFVGQWFLSTRYFEKVDLVKWFYSGEGSPEQLAGFLSTAGIRWVIYGPREIMMGPMPRLPGLVLAARTAGHEIWEWQGQPAAAPAQAPTSIPAP